MSTLETFYPKYDPWARFVSQGDEFIHLAMPAVGLTAGNNYISFASVVANTLPGAQLSGGLAHLPPGYYDVFFSMCINRVNLFKVFINNEFLNIDDVIGPSGYAVSTLSSNYATSHYRRLSVIDQKRYRFKIWCQTARASDGMYYGQCVFRRIDKRSI